MLNNDAIGEKTISTADWTLVHRLLWLTISSYEYSYEWLTDEEAVVICVLVKYRKAMKRTK